MTTTNIKNLPKGRYVTMLGYSDRHAYKVIRKTPKSMTIVPVIVESDPEWKPNFIAGGFVAHCDNQSEQTWLFKELGSTESTIRLNKKGEWSLYNTTYKRGYAIEYYDYNF